jgi:predicted Zn finger-like uncharacterized protein
MDVRCEKCQTEYELDEARLKPGGVTVKCTTCGHTFKIRKRTITNVGAPPVARGPNGPTRSQASSSKQPLTGGAPGAAATPGKGRGDALLDEDARQLVSDDAPATVERQWLIRLENGEHKSCRELATLQHWILSGVVTRESLISRNGKTWKRLGDVPDLGQYFTIADEARANRDRAKPASRPVPIKNVPGTILGYNTGAVPAYNPALQAAGGTILPDDDDVDAIEDKTTRISQTRPAAHTPPPVPPRNGNAGRTPPMGSNVGSNVGSNAGSNAVMMRRAEPAPAAGPPAPPARGPQITPPPPKWQGPGATPPPPPPMAPPDGNRATAVWATDGVAPDPSGVPASGPFVGKLAAVPNEPAFAGRVRIAPGDEGSFKTDKVHSLDDDVEDDEVLPARRGSRAGMLVLIMALLVMGAAAAVVYVFVISKGGQEHTAGPAQDAGAVTTVTPDAAAIVAPAAMDVAAPVAAVSPLDAMRDELASDIELRLRTAARSLEGNADAPSQGLRAHLLARPAQDLQDRASVTADKTAGDQLRNEARQLTLDAAAAAQRALKETGDDAGANLAMAAVLRLQGKPARESQRYLDTVRARADKTWARDLALADGLALVRDGKLEEAKAAFTAIDQGGDKLETSGDVRARLHLALVLAAQNKASEAKPLVATILAARPEHTGAKALADKLEKQVAKTDPLPPEDGGKDAASAGSAVAPRTPPAGPGPGAGPAIGGGESYDRLLAWANQLAETSCDKAMELYAKALEQKPSGVEALTGMGYCHIDAKEFASAHSKFRAALGVSSRYEPALHGVAEAYQQQGRKDDAIKAYRAYLDIYPNSAAAKRQLERLGAGAAASPPAPEPAPSSPAPAPAPEPVPPASSGNGSDSG